MLQTVFNMSTVRKKNKKSEENGSSNPPPLTLRHYTILLFDMSSSKAASNSAEVQRSWHSSTQTLKTPEGHMSMHAFNDLPGQLSDGDGDGLGVGERSKSSTQITPLAFSLTTWQPWLQTVHPHSPLERQTQPSATLTAMANNENANCIATAENTNGQQPKESWRLS